MEDQIFKVGDKVPQAGKYVCIICGLVIEYTSAHIEKGSAFGVCPLCQAGSEEGPKKPHEDFWKLVV